MNRTLTAAATALLLASLAACSNNSTSGSSGNDKPTAAPAASTSLDASTAFTQISGKVHAAKLSDVVTAANDGNHLLGRPNQYTSKVDFTDSRIKASDVQYTKKGDVDRGGSIEVFADPTDAQARAKYIQAVTKSMPALSEYDYVHGTVLVRVSHYLTPTQAGEYKAAADSLG
ncbi:hypothetical protein AAW14_06395 [Streptomyces hygroscopicus]|uniref:hypothetical protein n=1 Tax=Streptomyces hygroscopicus TaxID=1912 RepID=UPI00223F0E7C|nr:hypothetical protein [Streptomyces hygroscopicus]MCW7941758.1 hypothetical protein [Streptomyces hygroscopicus]